MLRSAEVVLQGLVEESELAGPFVENARTAQHPVHEVSPRARREGVVVRSAGFRLIQYEVQDMPGLPDAPGGGPPRQEALCPGDYALRVRAGVRAVSRHHGLD